jgi:predicted phosphodiesterase
MHTLPHGLAPHGSLDRRSFIIDGSLFLLGAGAALAPTLLSADPSRPATRIGLLTDMHYADKPARGSRHYRETLGKLDEAGERFEQLEPDLVVELGDFIDAADEVEVELGYLQRIQRAFSALPGEKHYVLGNHCVDTLTKQEFLGGVERKDSYYSFNRKDWHFIVLDSCFRSDGQPYGRKNFTWTDPNIPEAELEWLKEDLAETDLPTIVFAHQRLDVSNNYGVNNCKAVRAMLEASGQVRAVFQGHSHKNDLKEINGIPYCTLVAMVEGSGEENSGYSVLDILPDGTLRITGFRRQESYRWG